MELHSFDLTHNISNLIHDLNFFDDGQFKACYYRYHANDDLGQIFLPDSDCDSWVKLRK